MKIVFLGAEVGSNRTLLESAGATAMGVSYSRIVARGLPKTKKWLVADRFHEDALVIATPGITETKDMSVAECEDLAIGYQEFIVNNEARLAGFTEFDAPQLGPDWIRAQRPFYMDAGEKFWPVWNPELGYQDLVVLADNFSEIAVPNMDALNTPTHQVAGQMRAMTARLGTSWHGLGIASPETLMSSPLTTASTGSWQSPMRRGETIIWDGTRLVRYPKSMKEQARRRYTRIIMQAGLDPDLIMADDAKENTRLAIWSYQQLEKDMDKKKPGNNPFRVITGGGEGVDNSDELMTGLGGMLFDGVDNSVVETRQPTSRVPAPREHSERGFLPVLNVETKEVVEAGEDGRDTIKYLPILSSTGSSLRQCNTCFVAGNCPAFKPDSECAFSLPVSVKTKDQLVALLNAIIEMQGSRVAFARFGEELNGGYPDPNVSLEIDRLFKLVEQMKKLEDNREFVRMTIERQGGAGVLSSIFGDRAQAFKEIEGGGYNESQTTQIIQQSLDPQQ